MSLGCSTIRRRLTITAHPTACATRHTLRAAPAQILTQSSASARWRRCERGPLCTGEASAEPGARRRASGYEARVTDLGAGEACREDFVGVEELMRIEAHA